MSDFEISKAVEAARRLRLHIAALVVGDGAPLSDDDLLAIQDTFDGETTLEEEIEAAVLAEDDDYLLVVGIKRRQAELKERLDRIERRIEARRGLIEQAMVVAGWPKRETPLGTVSISKTPPRVEIDAEHDIPTQFFKRPDPVLDKASIKSILMERHKAIQMVTAIKDESPRRRGLRP